jgi:YVTN family beta-propeller protein
MNVMPRLKLILTAATLAIFAAGCNSSKPAPAPEAPKAAAVAETTAPRGYVTNEVSGDMTIFDTGNFNVLATIPLGKRPRGIHASPDGQTLYIALSGSPIGGPGVDESTLPPADHSFDGIGVFDVKQGKIVRTIKGGSDPENFDISKDGKQLYISNEDESEVSIVDTTTGEIKSLKMGAQPEGVKVTPDGKLVYITSEEDGNISVLDPAAGKILVTFPVGHRPRNVAFMPDGKKAYVNAENDGTVGVIDTTKHKMVKTIQLGKPGIIKPMMVLLSPDASKLYVSTGRGKTVATIDTATDKVLSSVEVGGRPWGIALSPDAKTLYSANGPANDIAVVDLATNTVTHRVKAGSGPWGVVILPR